MARALSFLIRYFSNYYTLHRSDLAARAAPLDPRLHITFIFTELQFSLQLADTIGARDRCPLIGSVRFLESF